MRSLKPILAALLLSGCAVGPDFKKPAPPQVNAYTPEPLAAATAATPDIHGGEAQRFTNGGDISGDWWTLFHSTALDALIAQALKNNPDLQAAQAALRVAHETALAGRGAYFPQIDANFSATRAGEPLTLAPVPNFPVVPKECLFNLFTPQVSVSYMPDVFGLNRRTVESLKAQEQARRASRCCATYTTLINNVVVTAIQEASTQQQIDATRELIDARSEVAGYSAISTRQGLCQRRRSGRAEIASSPRPRPRCRR